MTDAMQVAIVFWMSLSALFFVLMCLFLAKWRHAKFDFKRELKYRESAQDSCEYHYARNIALERVIKELTDEIDALRLGKANSSSYEEALTAQDALREAMKP